MRIAVDAMGGDYAPNNPVEAAFMASENGILVTLIGNEEIIRYKIKEKKLKGEVDIIHAEEDISMEENTLQALRKKKSSMRIAFKMVKNGEAGAIVSAGHSGAMISIGKMVLKTIRGINRPCFSAIMPSKKEKLLFLDVGANIACEPQDLLQFAIMGEVFVQEFLSIARPKIGLLNIGEEAGKGDSLLKTAYELLEAHFPNFIGNIEGKNFFNGDAQVIVTRGFAGNILLKSVQGAANFITHVLREEIGSSFFSTLGSLFLKNTFLRVKKRISGAQYGGGAVILGLQGVAVVTHGNSDVASLYSAIKFAHWAQKVKYVEKVKKRIETVLEVHE